MRGLIFDIDHFAVHDGPGIRTTVYMKGCPLRCVWCHSPESQSPEAEMLFVQDRCSRCGSCVAACPQGLHSVDKGGEHRYDREKCRLCGECANVCPNEALILSGRKMSVDEVMAEIAGDMVFFKNSGGGVTLTGGEVLAQADFCAALLKRLQSEGVHTLVETSGMGKTEHLLDIARYTDLFYYDIKVVNQKKHMHFTGASNHIILENLKALAGHGARIVIRVPLIPGYNSDIDDITAIYKLAMELHIDNVQLLPYNASAEAKYSWLGRKYIPGKLEAQGAAELESLLKAVPEGLKVEISSFPGKGRLCGEH